MHARITMLDTVVTLRSRLLWIACGLTALFSCGCSGGGDTSVRFHLINNAARDGEVIVDGASLFPLSVPSGETRDWNVTVVNPNSILVSAELVGGIDPITGDPLPPKPLGAVYVSVDPETEQVNVTLFPSSMSVSIGPLNRVAPAEEGLFPGHQLIDQLLDQLRWIELALARRQGWRVFSLRGKNASGVACYLLRAARDSDDSASWPPRSALRGG